MGNKKIAHVGQSTTKRWLQRLRSEGEMVSQPRGEEVCVVFSLHFCRLTSLRVICAFVLWGV